MRRVLELTEVFRKVRGGGVILAFVAIVAFASLGSPYFLSTYNLQALTRSLAFVGIVALGQACLLLIGELDLSLGSLAGFCGVIGGVLMVNLGYNPWLSFVMCLLLGAGCGLLNGTLVAKFSLNSLVVTVGMSGVYTGLNLVISQGRAITGIPRTIYFIGQGQLLGVPAPFVIMLMVALLALLLTQHTLFGAICMQWEITGKQLKYLALELTTYKCESSHYLACSQHLLE